MSSVDAILAVVTQIKAKLDAGTGGAQVVSAVNTYVDAGDDTWTHDLGTQSYLPTGLNTSGWTCGSYDDYIVILNGYDTAKLWKYYPDTNTLVQIDTSGLSGGHGVSNAPSDMVNLNGELYVIDYTEYIKKWNYLKNQFEVISSKLPATRSGYPTPLAGIDGLLYVTPVASYSTLYSYNPVTDTWTSLAQPSYPTSYFSNTDANKAVAIKDEVTGARRIMVVSGQYISRYEIDTNTWTVAAAQLSWWAGHSVVGIAAAGSGDRMFTFGEGYSSSGYAQSRNTVYIIEGTASHPNFGAGVAGPVLSAARRGAAACNHKGQIYLVGGMYASNGAQTFQRQLARFNAIRKDRVAFWTATKDALLTVMTAGVTFKNNRTKRTGEQVAVKAGDEITPSDVTAGKEIEWLIQ